jgi:hypothetical protein
VKLGAYVFPWTPDKWTIPDPVLKVGVTKTYSSSVVFDFGASVVGKEIELEWEWMSAVQFDALDALYQANLPVAWDTEKIGFPTFNVEIAELSGDLFEVLQYDEMFPHREKVKMTLLIIESTPVVMS